MTAKRSRGKALALAPGKDPVDPRRAFARHLRELMDKRRWTQSDVARETFGLVDRGDGVMIPARRDLVSKWLSCTSYPDRNHMADLARAFGVDVPEMLPPETRGAHEVEESPAAFVDIKGDPDFQIVRMNWRMSREAAKKIFDIVYEEKLRQRREQRDAETTSTTPAKRRAR